MICIDEKILTKHNITLSEFLLLLFVSRGFDYKETCQSLLDKKLVHQDILFNSNPVVTNNVKNLVADILVDSDKVTYNKDSEFKGLAAKMKEIFPKGKKAGTNYLWRDSDAVIARKLKLLVSKYDFTFTEEEALEATKRYVDSFNGDYTYMQLLKYFILKTDLRTGEIRSEFMSLIENKDDTETTNYDNGRIVWD